MTEGDNLSNEYERIKDVLEAENIRVSEFKRISYGLQFNIFIQSWRGLIRIYQNKKNEMKVDYSQLRNVEYSQKIRKLIEGEKIKLNSIELNGEIVEIKFPFLGTDESGKGDYFGPLVTAGVYVNEKSAEELVGLGVRDSKKLSDGKNRRLAQRIGTICKGNFSIIEISPEAYNSLYEKFLAEGKNLNHLLAWGHAKAIEEILSNVECEIAIADQFADERFILSKLQEKGKKLKLIQMHRAEENIAVASASILARTRFLDRLTQLSERFNIKFPKGASQKVIDAAKLFVDKHGEISLKKVAKLHFKTTNKVLNK